MLDRLQQARDLFESVFRSAPPPAPVGALAGGPSDVDALDIREPAVRAAWGNGIHSLNSGDAPAPFRYPLRCHGDDRGVVTTVAPANRP